LGCFKTLLVKIIKRKNMEIISVLIHSVPIVVGIALVALALDGEPKARKVSLVTGILLLILGLLIK
jgi:hypothetical protein